MSDVTVKYLKDYRQPDFEVEKLMLTVDISADGAMVTNEMVMRRTRTADVNCPLVLDGRDQRLHEVLLDGVSIDNYQLTDNQLILPELPNQFTLSITSQCQPKDNASLEGLYHSGTIYCTQCESHGFQRLTYYLDRPDVMTVFTTKIIADKTECPVLLSNGNCIDKGDLDDNRHYAVWEDPFKKPSYLFALVAGDLVARKDQFVTCSGRKIALEIYTAEADVPRTEYAMQALKDAMHWDEEQYGREYDLDIYMIVAVADFNMGAMENKGLNVFNTRCILADPKTATDEDFKMVQAVIAHEYFHNWTGNRVTCRDWFQLSLKEGLTVFRDQCFTADHHSETCKRIDDVNIIRSAQFQEDASPMAHPIRPSSYISMNNFYTVTVYNKGAEIIRMQRTLAGKSGFRQGMDLYFARHDGQAVTCDDFVAAIADANNLDMAQFKRWYSQAGTPVVSIEATYDAEQKTYTLHCQQNCAATADGSEKAPFVIPMKTALFGESGQALSFEYEGKPAKAHTVLLTEAKQTIVLAGVAEKPVPSLLRDFSAPVKLLFDYSDEERLFLYRHDDNGFNRWEAGQQYATQLILQLAEHPEQSNAIVPDAFIQAVKQMLHQEDLDSAFVAAAVTVPSENIIMQVMQPTDPAALHQAREFVVQTLAQSLKADWLAVYERCQTLGEYQLSRKQMAARKLKNVALGYLSLLDDAETTDIIKRQFHEADNMTDQIAALACLVQGSDLALRDKALAAFHEQWQHEPLVMVKWLAVQAMCKHSDTVKRVESLVKHPSFEITNPNKVYALLGGFSRNLAQFHRLDGEGHQFLAKQVAAIDKFNPQAAARMVRPLISWQHYVPVVQASMLKALEMLADEPLSEDVYEIVSKSLALKTTDQAQVV